MMRQQGKLSLHEMCYASGVSRAAYHRHWSNHAPLEKETALRDRVQILALENRYYGYRRILALLKREGWEVNHKHVLRLMREDNLLSLRTRSFVNTTNSKHELHIYPNLAGPLVIDGLDQLWVADITYIRLREEFVYAAIVLDAFSRRVIGWSVEKNLQSSLALHALEQAFAGRTVKAGLIHHSDRGVQYASAEYTGRLLAAGIRISMSRVATPWDNAKAESFMRTLKAEQVNAQKYRNLEEARTSIGAFIQEHYNERRLHSSLGYRSPVEFERERNAPCGGQ
jgi:putative transposase